MPATATALLVVQQAAAGAAKDVSVGVADRLWREVAAAAGEGVAAAVSHRSSLLAFLAHCVCGYSFEEVRWKWLAVAATVPLFAEC